MSGTLLIIIGVVGAIILISILLSIASFSTEKFIQIYDQMSDERALTEMRILDFIHSINANELENEIRVQQSEEDIENFYVSSRKIVALSKKTLTSNSIASFAIVAHEMGHALQDKEGNKLHVLNFMRRLGLFVGYLFLPAILAGLILLILGGDYYFYAILSFCIAGGIFFLSVLIKSVTISIEKDASKKGEDFLKEVLSPSDVKKCIELLNAARLTYWGDLFRLLLSWTFMTRKTKMFRR